MVTTGGRNTRSSAVSTSCSPLRLGGVFVLADGLEAKLARDKLDLIEVKTLVDGDHQPKVLESERDNLCRGNFQLLRQLADGDELVDTHGFPLFLYRGAPLCLDVLTRDRFFTPDGPALPVAAAHRRHRLEDVG